MTAGFDKFTWFKAIYAETRPTPADQIRGLPPRKRGFTDAEKAVLGFVAVLKVLSGKDTFAIRQSTLAEQCGTSRKTVNIAFSRAKYLGYLIKDKPSKSAPGRYTPAEWRLSIPKQSNESLHGSDERSNESLHGSDERSNESLHGSDLNDVTNSDTRCNGSTHRSPNDVTNPPEQCNPATPSNSGNVDANSIKDSTGKENSFGGVDVAAPPAANSASTGDLVTTNPTDPPQGYPWCCPQHPYGTKTDPKTGRPWGCTACQVKRLMFQKTQAWFDLVHDASMNTRAAERKGKKDAPITALALSAGRDPAEVRANVLEMLEQTSEHRNGHNGKSLSSRHIKEVITVEAVEEITASKDINPVLNGGGALTVKAKPVLIKAEKTPRQEQRRREPRPIDFDCPTCHVLRGCSCSPFGVKPHRARELAAEAAAEKSVA